MPRAIHSIWRRVRAFLAASRQRRSRRMMPYSSAAPKMPRRMDAVTCHHTARFGESAELALAATTVAVSASHAHIDRLRSGKIAKKRTIRNGSAELAARWITCSPICSAAMRFGIVPTSTDATASTRKVTDSRRSVPNTAHNAHESANRPTAERAR
jgi:hypothetical protein